MTTDNHWRFYSACFGQHELFDSVEDYNGRDHYPFAEEAKRICREECPVFEKCKRDTDDREPQGIWAGEIYPRKKKKR